MLGQVTTPAPARLLRAIEGRIVMIMTDEYGRRIKEAIVQELTMKLHEYMEQEELEFSSQYMVTSVWAEDIVKQIQLFARVQRHVDSWFGDDTNDWEVFRQELLPYLDYTNNEEDADKYEMLTDIVQTVYNAILSVSISKMPIRY